MVTILVLDVAPIDSSDWEAITKVPSSTIVLMNYTLPLVVLSLPISLILLLFHGGMLLKQLFLAFFLFFHVFHFVVDPSGISLMMMLNLKIVVDTGDFLAVRQDS